MGTLGLCETCLHRTSMVSGQKEHRTGFVFSSLQPQYLLEATHGKKYLFWFTVWVQSIQKGRFWWDRTVHFMASREPKRGMLVSLVPLAVSFFPFILSGPCSRA